MFDTVCRATFAPKRGYACARMYVSLGHTSNSSMYPSHEIIDATRISSTDIDTTVTAELTGSKDGLEGGGSASWTYGVDAQKVTNDFFATNERTWCFEPINGQSGDAWIEEPGIRSVSAAKRNCYTTVTLECPFLNLFGWETYSNSMSTNVYFTYGA